jgi:hypothetical protein
MRIQLYSRYPCQWFRFMEFCQIRCRLRSDASGAISFYLDHFVRARVSKLTYGYFGSILYDPSDDHRSPSHNVFISPSGRKLIDVFDIILPKVSCLISFQKYVIKIFCKKVSEVKKILYQGIRFYSWFLICWFFYLVLPWNGLDSKLERH